MTGIAPDDATRQQIRAARPDASTWLAANAGSGKTKVLTDRVARLLLNEVQPQHILCLTYTKAAASEMQNRLFRRLGEWAMLENDALRRQLSELGADAGLDDARLNQARTLFARALETPGGLKIQTIHSFCASLLRRFPLEARVSPQFSEMEDRAAALLRAEIVEDFADGPQAELVDGLARHITDMDFDAVTAAIIGRRDGFARPATRADLLAAFGLPEDADDNLPLRVAFDGSEADLIAQAAPILAQYTSTMVRLADALLALDLDSPSADTLAALQKLFLYSDRPEAKTAKTPTVKAQEALGPLLEPFHAFMERIAAATVAGYAVEAVAKSQALHEFAAAFVPEYERRKQLRGWLDFDDLIGKARRLLNDPEVAAWVLFRLDGGIDHILVDEAQDTSPLQWAVIERLAQEFTAGEGARADTNRTIFVVGDKKQSIYSFQGADPAAFDRMQAEFGSRLADSGGALGSLSLEYSFRSAPTILELVDRVFDSFPDAGFSADMCHRAFHHELPGRVDLWPLAEPVDDNDDRHWTDPVDRPGSHHHTVVLADRIAAGIKHMITGGATLPEIDRDTRAMTRRPVRAGDVLILVQRRSPLFTEIIRACKSAGLPIAGADRLKVGAELAVRDLAAMLSFLATPEDSLSLATALKSPLLGWDEQALFDLAHRRDAPFLWQALRTRRAEFPDTMAILEDLRDRTDYLRPYDLIERILTRHDGRRRLLARLGTEAEDGINALLSQALAYESNDVPSLTGFLVWMQTDDLEIKRQVSSGGDLIRVMTVHGAKGLEAPIVILPDTGARNAPKVDAVLMDGDLPLWTPTAARMPPHLQAVAAEKREKAQNERLRLLYVALTRAEKWLIVAAAGKLPKDGGSWYQMVETAMSDLGAEPLDFEGGPGLRLDGGDWDSAPLHVPTDVVEHRENLPDFARHSAPPDVARPATLSPSDLGGPKALSGAAGLDEEAAMLRGDRIHRLLEHLPGQAPNNRAALAERLLPDMDEVDRAACLAEAAQVLDTPALAHVFAAETLAEVPVTATIGGRRIHGIIDRLVVTGDRVLAVDFKTNATVPATAADCPEGLLRQMGAYSAALSQIYPQARIETAILWTATAMLMPLAHDLVTDALARSDRLDDPGDHS